MTDQTEQQRLYLTVKDDHPPTGAVETPCRCDEGDDRWTRYGAMRVPAGGEVLI